MYKTPKMHKSLIKVKQPVEGETIELKVRRLIDNKEPIKDGSPLIYTERSKGVDPAHNIRTDRFELACEAMDKIHKSKLAKREDKGDAKTVKMDTNKNNDGKAEPTDGKLESK